MSKSNPYGYTGGRVQTDQGLEGLSLEQRIELDRLGKVQRSRPKNFDSRFGGPIFKEQKRVKWHQRILERLFRHKYSSYYVGLGLSICAWGPVVWAIANVEHTAQENADRDILIRKAFENHGHKWWAWTMPYNWRYKELLKEDYIREKEERERQKRQQ